MARIRSIKPSIWTDERFIELSRDARLLCLGMISNADDEGRLIASAAALIGDIYPHDEVKPREVEKWRDEVADQGLVTVYRHGKGTYAAFPGWRKHQYIQKRQPSTLPAPSETEHEVRSGRDAGPRSVTQSGSRSDTQSGSGSGPEVEVEVDRDKEVEVDRAPLTRARPVSAVRAS